MEGSTYFSLRTSSLLPNNDPKIKAQASIKDWSKKNWPCKFVETKSRKPQQVPRFLLDRAAVFFIFRGLVSTSPYRRI